MHLKQGLANLRRPVEYRVVRTALRRGSLKPGFRLNQFSVQSNHLDLIVEASDRNFLGRGMCGLGTRLARNLNRLWGLRGRVFAERYHSVLLRSPRQVRNALRYVLNNVLRHGGHLTGNRPDPCSSGEWFDGWKDRRARSPSDARCPVAPARSRLQRLAWRRHGLLQLLESPRGVP